MAVGDLHMIKILFTSSLSGETLSTSIVVRQDDVVAPAIATVGDDVKDWWNVALGGAAAHKSFCAPSVSLSEVQLRRVVPVEPVIQSYTTGLPIAGTAAGQSLPPSSAVVASLRTAKIGKRYRGRMYLPPVTETDSDGNLLSATANTMRDQLAAFGATLVVDSMTPVVYSRVLGTGEPITAYWIDARLRDQRRRSNRTPVYTKT